MTLSPTYLETYLPRTGSTIAVLTFLPAGWSYKITMSYSGKVWATSRAGGNGSVRHYEFRTYQQALDHGTAWAKRRLAAIAKKAVAA